MGRVNNAYREQTFRRYMHMKQRKELLVPDGMGGYEPLLEAA